ncbi:MarR family winged helix-turn-helix transcriptional regulator [Streptomyces angustmyceticus]|uniref:MarR family winged helix-turn-helix transcriptional regulator n=1 Tax=Streptomyces angustmyceticus TaxID=285578 RepID=UPI0021AF6A5A|nr:MarR family winged helix-turn-helix transcriptional regulator [Streptomyces angustmyceticus]
MKDPHESAGADGDEATATGGPTTAEALTQDPAPAEDPAEDLLYGVIRRLWPLHRTVVRAVERELAGTGMTAGEHALLDALRTEGPRTVPQLARGMGLDRQPVQRWVNHAVELGLVVTAPNPAHRRSSLIRLTPRGTEAIRGVQEFEATQLRRRLADLPAEDVRTALHVLDRLGEEFQHLANSQRPAPEETDSTDSPDSHRNHPNSDNGGDSGITPAPPHPAHKGRSRR